MKKSLLLIVLFVFIFPTLLFSQGILKFTFTVVDTKLKPIKSMKIVLKESVTNDKIVLYTDASGTVNFELKKGLRWWMSVGKMHKYKSFDVPPGGIMTGSEYMTYDIKAWEHENQPMFNRSNIVFTKVVQNIKPNDNPNDNEIYLQLDIKTSKKKALTDYPVIITSIELKKQYHTNTDARGIAHFHLPVGKTVEIDIDGIESYNFLKLPEMQCNMIYKITYDPTDITEKIINDTIYQTLPNDLEGTSARMKYEIIVKNTTGELLKGENVYLNLINSKKVYYAKTDKSGKATFLLPIKKKYMINLDFEKDIDVINLMRIRGIGEGNFILTYRPDPKLQYPERYIPTSQELLINEFNNFISKQYPNPEKDKPFRLFIKWGNEFINGKSKEAILEVAFTSNEDISNKYGPQINISFVVDKSGSMAGYDRIDALKKSLLNFINSLRANDIVSLIAFNQQPELLIPSDILSGKVELLAEEIKNIEAQGGTNIYNGMVLGYEELLKNFKKGGTNRLILLTDGYGITEVDVIVNKSKEYNEKGLDISGIGVGYVYNQALLKLLTTNSGGMFQHVSESCDLEESFKRELTGMLYPVATNVSIEIEFNNRIIFNNLYGFKFSKAGNKVIVKLDNIYPSMNKLALVKFDLNIPDKTIENQPVVIRMKYYNYKTQMPEEISEKAYLKWSEEKGNYELIIESEEKKLYAIAIMNQSLKVMADAFSLDKYEEAQAIIERATEQINELYPDAKQEDIEKLYQQLYDYSQILIQYKKNKLIKQ